MCSMIDVSGERYSDDWLVLHTSLLFSSLPRTRLNKKRGKTFFPAVMDQCPQMFVRDTPCHTVPASLRSDRCGRLGRRRLEARSLTPDVQVDELWGYRGGRGHP